MPASKRSPKLDDELVEWLCEGKTLRAFARHAGISWVTVYNWMNDDPDLSERVARARLIGEEAIVGEMQEIADEGDEDDVQHRKLKLWMREKRLVWSNPQRYGQKQQIQQTVEHKNTLSDTERAVRIKQLLAKAGPQVTAEIGPVKDEDAS